jgi:hypothetical protein
MLMAVHSEMLKQLRNIKHFTPYVLGPTYRWYCQMTPVASDSAKDRHKVVNAERLFTLVPLTPAQSRILNICS